ncbi:hypothetical protein [Winogradskyella arenosi]|nr:hypothetical protein [Winogradskyella arenosi]
MKSNNILFHVLFALFCLMSCQEEVSQIEDPTDQEALVFNSSLVEVLRSTTSNYKSSDDFLDGASCVSVQLPVTLIVNNVAMTLTSDAELQEFQLMLNTANTTEIDFNIVFPITVILSDYTTSLIAEEEELENLSAACEGIDSSYASCLNFIYPISFSVFNANFNTVEIVQVEDDQAFYEFLGTLSQAENNLIVSLNYPLHLNPSYGDNFTVTDNDDLLVNVTSAETFCNEEPTNCVEDEVLTRLEACSWSLVENSDFNNLRFVFHADGSLELLEGLIESEIIGSWNLSSTNGEIMLTFSDLTTFETDLEGNWIIEDCSGDDFTISQNSTTYLLEQQCDLDALFNCFNDFELVACADLNGEAVFNLSAQTIETISCTETYNATFFTSQSDAQSHSNPIPDPEAYISATETLFLKIEAAEGEFQLYSVFLNAVGCNDFECFDAENQVLETCYTDTAVLYAFNLMFAYQECTAETITFYEQLMEAETEVNPISDPTAYQTALLNTTVYARVEINQQFQIYPITLNVVTCNEESCNATTVEARLATCLWTMSSYNGSDNLDGYTLDFQSEPGVLEVYDDSISVTAAWSVYENYDGVGIDFYGISTSNIQVINGSWLIITCHSDEMMLQSLNDNNLEMVLNRTCE